MAHKINNELKKTCVRCHRTLPLSRFNKNNYSKDGHSSYCAECNREYQREYAARRRAETEIEITNKIALRNLTDEQLYEELERRGYRGRLYKVDALGTAFNPDAVEAPESVEMK